MGRILLGANYYPEDWDDDLLDVAQFNHYRTEQSHNIFYTDYMRHFSKIPFWNTEIQACWNGSTCMGHYVQGETFKEKIDFKPYELRIIRKN